MATPMQTQPSPMAPRPPMHPLQDPEPGARLAQEAVPYRGPSQRNYKGRLNVMYGLLGVIVAISLYAVIRVLYHGGL